MTASHAHMPAMSVLTTTSTAGARDDDACDTRTVKRASRWLDDVASGVTVTVSAGSEIVNVCVVVVSGLLLAPFSTIVDPAATLRQH